MYKFIRVHCNYLQGCDIEKDVVVLKSGERLGASEVGLLATVGVMMVKVLKKHTVCLLEL